MSSTPSDRPAGRSLIQHAALVVGAAFVLGGVLGFVPGITTDYEGMTFAGYESTAKLLGIFMVSVLHNVVHLAFGVAGIAMSRSAAASRLYLIGGGAIYLLLWIYGLVIDKGSASNFVPLNTADDWLHFVLGAGMIGLGVALSRRRVAGRGARSSL